MSRLLLFIGLFILNQSVNAQPSIESIKKLIIANKLMDAKVEVENFLSLTENVNNANAWYFKGFIYNLISKDSTIEIPLTNAKAVAFNAFTKCLEINPKQKWLEKDSYYPLFDIYASFYENGKKEFVNNNFDIALEYFLNAEKVSHYLFEKKLKYNGFGFSNLDTSLLYNLATTAIKANKEKEGIFYFVKIAEARLNDPVYLPIYHTLVDYFVSINDEIAFRKYLKIGRSLFPYDNYWVEAELDMVQAGKLTDALIKDYETKLKSDPNNFNLEFNYCNDLIQIIFNIDNKPRNVEMIKNKLEDHLSKAMQLQKNGFKTEYLYAQYYYKNALSLNNETKDSTLKKEFSNKAIPYAITVFQNLENNNRQNRYELDMYKTITKLIIDCNKIIGDEKNVSIYQEKLKTIETILPVMVTKKPK